MTLKSLLQHHSSKASILWHSAFFTVQLSHPYMTTGKTIALSRPIFVLKVMSLLFNMLSRLVITFLPRSKRLFFFLLYNTVLVLPYIDMNPPWVYMSSQSWTPLPPLSPYHLSNFMAAVTICSDFGAPQNKVWHCFHCFPIYLPWTYMGSKSLSQHSTTYWHNIDHIL